MSNNVNANHFLCQDISVKDPGDFDGRKARAYTNYS